MTKYKPEPEPEVEEPEGFPDPEDEYIVSLFSPETPWFDDDYGIPETYGGVWYDPHDMERGDNEIEISLDHATEEEWAALLDKLAKK